MEVSLGAARVNAEESPGKIVFEDKIEKYTLTGDFNTADVIESIVNNYRGREYDDFNDIRGYLQWDTDFHIDSDSIEEMETPLNGDISIGDRQYKIGELPGKIVFQDEDGSKAYLTGDFDASVARAIIDDIARHFDGDAGNGWGDHPNVFAVERYATGQKAAGNDLYRLVTHTDSRYSKQAYREMAAEEAAAEAGFEDFTSVKTTLGATREEREPVQQQEPVQKAESPLSRLLDRARNFISPPKPEPAQKAENPLGIPAEPVSVTEEPAKERTPEETAFLHALDQRRVVAGALRDGSLACLPGRDGYADTEPAVNIADGTRCLGANQLYLKDFQKKNGFPTAEFVTAATVEKSGVPIRKGQHGVWADFKTQNEQTQAWEQKSVRLFNIAQTESPAKMRAFAGNALAAKQREKQEYLRQMYGDSYQPKEQGKKKPGPEIVCSSAEPEKYLGQYLAAVSMGGKFKASGEQAAEFSKKMGESLFERTANGHTNPFKLAKICNAAGEHSRSVIAKQAMPAPRHEQKRELKRGRSM